MHRLNQGSDEICVLATGGAGYIGSHVVYALLDRGYRVVVLDNLSTGERDLVADDAIFVEGDVGDRRLVQSLLDEHACRAVLHFAAAIVVPESVQEPIRYYANNVANSIALLQSCQNSSVDSFVFSSTAAVYDGDGHHALTEDDKLGPANPYGRSKLMIETILRDVAAISSMRYGILRYFNVAGADPQMRTGQSAPVATHLIKRACQAAVGTLDHIDVFGSDYPTPDGTAVRDYIHVSDLATAHIQLLEQLLGGGDSSVLNCGYGHGFSVRQVLEAVERVAGAPLDIRPASRREGDAASLIANPDRLRKLLGWVPEYDDLDRIVETALRWERRLRQSESAS